MSTCTCFLLWRKTKRGCRLLTSQPDRWKWSHGDENLESKVFYSHKSITTIHEICRKNSEAKWIGPEEMSGWDA